MENDFKEILIVDDDRLSREVLVGALNDYGWVKISGLASSAEEALRVAEDTVPDIIFLDIELNNRSALDILERLREVSASDVKIIFYTSYKKYLMQALRLEAFDFLLKPIDPEELKLIMNRCRLYETCRRKTESCASDRMSDIATDLSSPLTESIQAARRGLSVTTITNDRMILFPRDIVFFRYDPGRKLWEVILTSLQHFILKHNTTADTILNYGPQFARTHKSFIVNVAFIGMISGNECRLIPPYDKLVDIRISKIYRRQLLDRFYDI